MPERRQLQRVCVMGAQIRNGTGQVRVSYARDGNEAANENGSQGSPYIDNCGHADSCVGKEKQMFNPTGKAITARENISNADGELSCRLVLEPNVKQQ